MKKTCGALVIGLLITTNVYAKETKVSDCEKVISLVYLQKSLSSGYNRLENEAVSRLQKGKDCILISSLLLAAIIAD